MNKPDTTTATIKTLKNVLEEKGAGNVELEQKENNSFLLRIAQGFRAYKNKAGIVITINGANVILQNFCSITLSEESVDKKMLILVPNPH